MPLFLGQTMVVAHNPTETNPDHHYFEIGDHFLKQIYYNNKGRIRLAVLKRDLAPFMRTPKPLEILDIGAGAGQMALWCAAFGHRVTLFDASERLLAQAQKQAQKESLNAQCTFICGEITQMPDVLGARQFDFVLSHAVLEWLEDGAQLFERCQQYLKPNGLLSLMYYNRSALEFIQHVFGNFSYVDSGLVAKKTAKLTPKYPRSSDWVAAQLGALPLKKQSGIRCFYDYMKPEDRAANSIESIIAHELSLSLRREFLPVARYIHEIRQRTISTAN